MNNSIESNGPEWTAEQMNRKLGDTTFKQCGWCGHRGCGSYRYDCMISGSCKLLQDYRNDVKWDTQCKIVGLGRRDIERIMESKGYDIKEKEQCIVERKKEIKVLKHLFKKAKHLPPLPENRAYNHFNDCDCVYVFWKGKWERGIVAPGYRSHDGCVSYVLDNYPESQGGIKGPWGCGIAVPGILKAWEYVYFKNDKKAFREWLIKSDRNYNGEKMPIEDYYRALEEEGAI